MHYNINMKISVIIPIYNTCIDDIKFTVESILKQTYKNWECIIVDDGSLFNSDMDEFLKKITDKDNRFSVLKQSNQGPGCARNYGIAHSEGDIIVFIDDSDYLYSDHVFSKYVELFTENKEVDIIMIQYFEFKDKLSFSGTKYNSENLLNDDKINIRYFFDQWITCCKNVYRKEFLIVNDLLFLQKKVFFEDAYFNLICNTLARNIYFLADQVYVYNTNNQGSTTNKNKSVCKTAKIKIDNIIAAYNWISENSYNKKLFLTHALAFVHIIPFDNSKVLINAILNCKTFRELKQNKLTILEIIILLISRSRWLSWIYCKILIPIATRIIRIIKR